MKFFAKTLILIAIGTLNCCSSVPNRKPSQQQADFCQTGLAQIQARYTPPYQPKYFFKPVGDGSTIAFVGFNPKTVTDQNYLFELKTGKMTPIPGYYDPIGLFGTDLLTVPIEDVRGRTTMSFYDLRELRVSGVNTKPVLSSDVSLLGRYQSLGVLARSGQKVQFRVITDGDLGGNFRDFEADFTTQPLRLRSLTQTVPLCRNLRDKKTHQLKFKLPMLSKDGQLISVFDLDEQKMRLFKIKTPSGNCDETDFPAINRGDVGKLDFSPTTQVAFHYSDRSLDLSPLTFGEPQTHWQLRSAIYDFKKQTYRLLPFFGKSANTFYPAFLPNGHLMFLQSQDERFEFLEIDPEQLKEIPKSKIERLSKLSDGEFKPFLRLSDYFVERCFVEPTMSLKSNRILNLLSLSELQCVDLASEVPIQRSEDRTSLIEACHQLNSSQ